MGLRAFVAIDLTEENRRVLDHAKDVLLDVDPAWVGEKWVSSADRHVTAAFLPDVEPWDVYSVVAALQAACAAHDPFTLALSGVRAVPRPARARMLWAELADEEGDSVTLASDVREALRNHLDPRPAKPFRPHATLVRARKTRAIRDEALVAAGDVLVASGQASLAVPVASLTLYSSTLTRTGPVYESIASVPLRAD